MADRPARPNGMQWVNTYMVVKDVDKAMGFYEEAFGFKPGTKMPGDDGKTMHGEMIYKDATIMMGAENLEQGYKAPATLTGSPVSFYIYVDKVDDFFNQAKAAGAEVIHEPSDQFWGDRMCAFKDPDGHMWSFATNVADFDPSKTPGK